MIAKNRAQLKAWIKNMSEKIEVNENIILQNYMLERLLERISVSDYKYKFVLKGGMLITAIVGIDMRNTLDMDATIKEFDLEKDNLEKILYQEMLIQQELGIFMTSIYFGLLNNKILIKKVLGQAILKKFEYRESMDKLNNINEIMEVIKESVALKEHWKNYQAKFSYAEDISYEDTMKVLEEIVELLI